MNLLALEGLIVERLRARLPADILVLAAASVDEAITAGSSHPSAAVYVFYAGGNVSESSANGRTAIITQEWSVLVVARNMQEQRSGAIARASAGALADQVLDALMGWRPEGAGALALSALPDPGYITGYQWVPLQFSTTLMRSVSNQ
jgi:hypothetical protein